MIAGVRTSWPHGGSSSNRGREQGRENLGRGNILAQVGNRRLIASNITGTSTGVSGVDANHPMYKEFMEFIKSKQTQGDSSLSYPAIVNDEAGENTEVTHKNAKDEVILLLENIDLQWKDDPW